MTWTEHENAPARGTELCKLDAIDPDGGKELFLGDTDGGWPFRMFVVRRGSEVRGYVNTCPHQHIPLNFFPDRFLSPDKELIQCANHGALFEFDDGTCVAGPCVGESLQPVPLTVREADGMVMIA